MSSSIHITVLFIWVISGKNPSFSLSNFPGKSVTLATILCAWCVNDTHTRLTALFPGHGMVICLERDTDLHMARLMPLPLNVSCFSKIQIGLPFWYRLTRVVPDKGPLNGWCVCDSGSSGVNLEVLVDGVDEHKEDVSSVGDVDVRRRLAQLDARDCGSLGQRSAVAVMLRQDSLQFVNKLFLYGNKPHTDSCHFR